MIFSPELARKVRNGTKTMHRRPAKPGDTTCPYQPGRTYCIQPGRGEDHLCRVEITDIHLEQLGDIDDHDAHLEGFSSHGAFIDHWLTAHGTINLDQLVWVITFKLPHLVVREEQPASRLAIPWDPGTEDGAMRRAPEPERVRNRDLVSIHRLGLHQWQRDRAEYVAALAAMPLKDRVENARRLVAESRSATVCREFAVLNRLLANGKSDQAVDRRLTAIEDAALPRAA